MEKFGLILLIISILSFSCQQSPPNKYILEEIDLTPEGIAYSNSTKLYYLTSIAKSKIITVDKTSGEQKDFIMCNQYGFNAGVGICVNDKLRKIYALAGYYMTNDSATSLFEFDIDSHKLVARYDIKDTGNHFLNDLIIDSKNHIYITDTKASAIYQLKAGTDSLEVFFQSNEIQYPNGIAISDDDSKLYIASFSKGVRILDLQTKELLNKEDPIADTKGIDGLEYYKGHLYAIQNATEKNGDNFRKLILNKNGNEITGIDIIDSNNPELDVPLTFCIENNRAVVIGNSNLEHLDQVTMKFPEPDSLKKTKLLVYKIE